MDSVNFIVSSYKEGCKKLLKNNPLSNILINYYSVGALYFFPLLLLQILLFNSISDVIYSSNYIDALFLIALFYLIFFLVVVAYVIHIYRLVELFLVGKIESIKDTFMKFVVKKYLTIIKAVLFSIVLSIPLLILDSILLLIPIIGVVFVAIISIAVIFSFQIVIVKSYFSNTSLLGTLKKAISFVKKEPLLVFLHMSILFVFSIITNYIVSLLVNFNEIVGVLVMPLFLISNGIVSTMVPLRLVKEKIL